MPHEKTAKESYVFWQISNEGIPEQAILIEFYDTTISLTQEGRLININRDSLNEFIKIIKKQP